VPAVPTFSVDAGFWYAIPEHLKKDVGIGVRVRVPLGGRKVRGFVVEVGEREGELKEILGVSGEVPVFDSALLKVLRWAAQHYVAPLSVVLEKAAPPTLPKLGTRQAVTVDGDEFRSDHPLSGLISALAGGERHPAVAYCVHWSDPTWMNAIAPLLASEKSVMVIAPTVRESALLAESLRHLFAGAVVLVPDKNDATVTRAWEAAASPATVLVGTPRIAAWPMPHLGLAVVSEESRRAMKDRQTPTIHVRDLLRTRSRVEGFGLLYVGPTPSVEVIAAGAETIQPTRPWGLVEIVDRREDPPGSGFLSDRSVFALKHAAEEGNRAFVFTHLRATDASARCVSCRQLRRCTRCGSHVGQRPACPRCGLEAQKCANCGGVQFESMGSIPGRIVTELEKRLGVGLVGLIEGESLVTVGTERDLAGVEGVTLAVAVDVDALLYGPNYRAGEEAMRILARLVGTVARGKGYRAILQTSNPESNLVAALRRGEPIPYLESILVERAREGLPPATELRAFEVKGPDSTEVTAQLEEMAPGMVMGPIPAGDRSRWLLQGDLGGVKTEMRRFVQRLRDSGATVRVDADPIDL
jgi:primosomal protein N' (replication factor Y)